MTNERRTEFVTEVRNAGPLGSVTRAIVAALVPSIRKPGQARHLTAVADRT